MRLVALLLAVLVVSVLAGLGAEAVSAGEADPGIATGKAVPCAGPIFVPTAHLAVYSRKVLVARKTIPTGKQFRFVLPPGRYTISDEGHYVAGPTFVVHADRTTHVVVMNYCM